VVRKEGERLCESRKRDETNLEEAHDVPHVLLESHVNHPISLVEAEIFASGEAKLALLEHVLQTSGRRDDHVETARHDLTLLGHVDTSDTEEGANAASEWKVSYEGKVKEERDERRVVGLLHQLAHLDESIVRLPRQLTLQVGRGQRPSTQRSEDRLPKDRR